MFYLYVLKSGKIERHYIGITKDKRERLERHNKGLVHSTKAYGPWEMVWSEVYKNRSEAQKRELFLKNNYQARIELFNKIDMASSSNG